MKNKREIDFINLSGRTWELSIILFFVVFGIGSSIQDSRLKDITSISKLIPYLSVSIALVGIISFLITILGLLFRGLKKRQLINIPDNLSRRRKILRSTAIFLSLPFYLIYTIIKPKQLIQNVKKEGLIKSFNLKSIIFKTFGVFLSSILIPFWICIFGFVIATPLILVGILPIPTSTQVTGASMLPTLTDNSAIDYYWYIKKLNMLTKIQKGDIVVFKNTETTEGDTNEYFVKRVVATEGDIVELRDGFLLINDQIVEEPYTLQPRSTFGNEFLKQCESITIPKGSVFVLGDNRLRSKDSRYIGPIDLNNIRGYLPFSKQDVYRSQWRDASKDKDSAGLPSFDIEGYYELLNKTRIDNNLKPLKVNPKLEGASKRRAEAIINYNELNTMPENSKYPHKTALRDAGYSNITTGEINTSGYFDTDNLLNYWMDYSTKDYVLNKDYQETGVAAVVGQINGCQNQIVVQEFGGYIPPNYKQSDIDGWQSTLNRLREILPSWENIKNFPSTYNTNKQVADRLLEIIKLRISRIDSIVSKMKANEWLTSEEKQWTWDDTKLYNEQEALATKLNSIKW